MTFFKNLVKIHFFTKLVANWYARGTTSPKYTGAIQNLISVLGNHPSEFEKRLFFRNAYFFKDFERLPKSIFQSIFLKKIGFKGK